MLKFIGPFKIETNLGWARGATVSVLSRHLGFVCVQWSVHCGMLGIFWNWNGKKVIHICL